MRNLLGVESRSAERSDSVDMDEVVLPRRGPWGWFVDRTERARSGSRSRKARRQSPYPSIRRQMGLGGLAAMLIALVMLGGWVWGGVTVYKLNERVAGFESQAAVERVEIPAGFAERCLTLSMEAGSGPGEMDEFVKECNPQLTPELMGEQRARVLQVTQATAEGPPRSYEIEGTEGLYSVLVSVKVFGAQAVDGVEGGGFAPLGTQWWRVEIYSDPVTGEKAMVGRGSQVVSPVADTPPPLLMKFAKADMSDPRSVLIQEFLSRLMPLPPKGAEGLGSVDPFVSDELEVVPLHDPNIESVVVTHTAFVPAVGGGVDAQAMAQVKYLGGAVSAQSFAFHLEADGRGYVISAVLGGLPVAVSEAN